MKLFVMQGKIQESVADTIIVNLFEGVTEPRGATGAVNQALNGAISELIANGDMTGKLGEVSVLYPRGALTASRVLVVGLGKLDTFDLEVVRRVAGTAIKRARELNANEVATIIHGAGAAGLEAAQAAQATAEGSLLALYHYAAQKLETESIHEIQSLTLMELDSTQIAAVEGGVRTALAIAQGVYLARDLTNMPPNIATPTRLAAVAQEIALQHRMVITVGDRDWAARHRMGGFLAVAKGAGEPPKFIILEHNRERHDLDTIVLVGKGITFDTGGISLKPSEHMENMKSDMAGAAAVLGTMKVVGLLNLSLRVVGLAPATENMPDAQGYHPADVITASNGKTVEIISTDAEGRMVLADALVYAGQYKPKAVIDLATLTGACVTALGQGVAAGLFSNDQKLQDRLISSGSITHERLWPLPLWDDYLKKIKSEVADLKNSGGRNGGVGTSAVFLKEFTDYPWAHVDMAGMALMEKKDETPYIAAGGSGYGVRLLIDFLMKWLEQN
jgi:leucyl aminopeptidase